MSDVSPRERCFNPASLGDELRHIQPECIGVLEGRIMTNRVCACVRPPTEALFHVYCLIGRLAFRDRTETLLTRFRINRPTGRRPLQGGRSIADCSLHLYRATEAETHATAPLFPLKNKDKKTFRRASRTRRLLLQPVGGASDLNVRCAGRSAAPVACGAGGAQQRKKKKSLHLLPSFQLKWESVDC